MKQYTKALSAARLRVSYMAELMDSPEFAAEYLDTLGRLELIDLLAHERANLGLSQTEIAKRLGVRQPTVSLFENEASDPRLSTIQRYARAVGKRVSLAVVEDASGPWTVASDYRQASSEVTWLVRDAEPSRREWAVSRRTDFDRAA
jgi:transcriptional regulator with XRE-family HTH domain